MSFALTAIVSMLIVLGIMVLVHEFGHFAVAKFFGVRVEVFSIGFGKRLFGFRRGDTDYRLSLLPLGGYVKMAGETPGEARTGDPDEFASHPRWQRVLIGLAGPVANFILAFVLMTGLYMMHNEVENYLSGPAVTDFIPQDSPAGRAGLQSGDRIVRFDKDHNPSWEQVRMRAALDVNSAVPVTVERTVDGQTQTFNTQLYLADSTHGGDFEIESIGLLPKEQNNPLGVRDVMPGNPADKAGLKAGDAIASINGQSVHSVAAVMAVLQQTNGKPAELIVDRKGQTLNLSAQPIWGDDGTGRMGYRLGFHPAQAPFHVEQLPISAAVRQSLIFNRDNSGYILDVLKRLVTRHSNIQQLSGPIGIARETGEAVTMPGWQPLIALMSLISLNLGIFNLLPIPILDGGMILLLLIEGTLRRDLNQDFKERVYQVAFVMLILFAAFVMFNDVAKLNILSKLKP
ncbi:RIP metalloprotease RseP [Silvibacterium dinghuense]|uniref:Zinc metalloprotease n=1 Tax=Silvibacterium dinghuense TaxID=1560006 RepID=A0A4Q1SE78_9BACT|nr:RIP metalloprotease RseP [Silvibacterium dinghuense]RXS95569.1 RIP metalloprotease RseP [Silvibacterium dinghuense]GGH14105.1 putative zinc metalloprotease [Silvibacterium dinghuense]